jgi:hypothetical protein
MTVGNVRGTVSEPAVIPTFSKIRGRAHLRGAVRGNKYIAFINGCPRLKHDLTEARYPWIGIHSRGRSNGGVANLQITGDPVIPQEIVLSENKDLTGWISYYGNSVGDPDSQWRLTDNDDGRRELVGSFLPELAGANAESLLSYHRPMLEDGSIEYEFFYRDGQTLVHPAIDRLALLLDPDCVRVHWVTDGNYERTGITPENVFDEPGNRRGPAALPLKPDQWNLARITLAGDTVSLLINGQLVYERKLEITNQRTFGLFHYADQTEARLRNIRWRGAWLGKIPDLDDQELAGDGMRFLDKRLPELTAVFDHDFINDGFATERFTLKQGRTEHVSAQSNGLMLERRGAGNSQTVGISPRLSLQGDFDVTIGFTHFVPQLTRGETSSLIMSLRMEHESATECILARRLKRFADKDDLQLVHASVAVQTDKGIRRRQFGTMPMEATSGRLRIARRGRKIFYLTAEGDSPEFRLVTEETIAADDIAYEGVALKCQTGGRGVGRVILTRLTIHAEKIAGQSVKDLRQIEADFNSQRDLLADVLKLDLRIDQPKDTLSTIRFNPSWKVDDAGRPVSVSNDPGHFSSTLGLKKDLNGDFDIEVELAPASGKLPAADAERSIRLQAPLSPRDRTAVSIVFRERSSGMAEVAVETRETLDDNRFIVQSVSRVAMPSASGLRILKREQTVTLLAREKTTDPYRIMAELPGRSQRLSPSAVRLSLEASGRDTVMPLRALSLSAHAENIHPLEADIVEALQAFEKQLTQESPEYALDFDGDRSYVSIPTLLYDSSHPLTYEVFATPRQKGGIVIGNGQFVRTPRGFWNRGPGPVQRPLVERQ